ncbi:unnamed protein product [Dovyalis caffra]|uniref:Non-specific lipid-transfer protein n=1 Tax=Dovyalis caffra TaxID=77055 RepID=A0AAV1QYD2_9ROSI|nr:unnamed protein product [Dovyalis caffra]
MVKKLDGAKWALGLVILWLSLGAAIVNATISCEEATATLTPCIPFFLGNLPPTPSDGCCAGAQKLDKLAASSSLDRKHLCECFVSAMKSYPVKPERVKQLPKLCKLKITIPSDPKVDCSKIHIIQNVISLHDPKSILSTDFNAKLNIINNKKGTDYITNLEGRVEAEYRSRDYNAWHN